MFIFFYELGQLLIALMSLPGPGHRIVHKILMDRLMLFLVGRQLRVNLLDARGELPLFGFEFFF